MAIGCLRIGLDDTDAPGGLCTTWLGAVLAGRLEAAGMPVRERRLVRLNPNAPFRTRGNAAIALLAEGDPTRALELACAAVEEFAPARRAPDEPGGGGRGSAPAAGVLPARRDRSLYGRRHRRRARRGRRAVPGVRQRARPDRGRGGRRGRVSRPDLRTPRLPRALALGTAARGGHGIALPGRGRDLPADLGLGRPGRRCGRLRPPFARPGPLRDSRRESRMGCAGTFVRLLRAGRVRDLLDDEPGDRRPPRPGPSAERSATGGRMRWRARSRSRR